MPKVLKEGPFTIIAGLCAQLAACFAKLGGGKSDAAPKEGEGVDNDRFFPTQEKIKKMKVEALKKFVNNLRGEEVAKKMSASTLTNGLMVLAALYEGDELEFTKSNTAAAVEVAGGGAAKAIKDKCKKLKRIVTKLVDAISADDEENEGDAAVEDDEDDVADVKQKTGKKASKDDDEDSDEDSSEDSEDADDEESEDDDDEDSDEDADDEDSDDEEDSDDDADDDDDSDDEESDEDSDEDSDSDDDDAEDDDGDDDSSDDSDEDEAEDDDGVDFETEAKKYIAGLKKDGEWDAKEVAASVRDWVAVMTPKHEKVMGVKKAVIEKLLKLKKFEKAGHAFVKCMIDDDNIPVEPDTGYVHAQRPCCNGLPLNKIDDPKEIKKVLGRSLKEKERGLGKCVVSKKYFILSEKMLQGVETMVFEAVPSKK